MSNERENHFRLEFDENEENSTVQIKVVHREPRSRPGWILVLLMIIAFILHFIALWALMLADQSDERREAMGFKRSKNENFFP